MRNRIAVIALLGLAAWNAAAQPTTTNTAPGSEDGRIEDAVRIRLAGNRDTGGAGRIKVEVKNGAVTLTGPVESEKQKSAAEKQAKKVKGVKSVANQLVITEK
jgi:hyperosmotically inducible protein